ncbi:hypothetical protein [Paenibacillus sp. UNC499MF]|uniref:hypothetical protein n=1 Tax=Paenibacillus sp. UNC499MF TaxID=1502751 RepID=UPI0015E23087|nr:hypothetical protein [Paenibacillus sp. UNC499MF]
MNNDPPGIIAGGILSLGFRIFNLNTLCLKKEFMYSGVKITNILESGATFCWGKK